MENFTYLRNNSWSQITREERYFCAELHFEIKKDPKQFISFLNDRLKKKFSADQHWEVGYEVCFFRDYLFSINQSVKPKYKGKVAILVNERTISLAEFTAMYLQSVENSITIGSQTLAADGNVSRRRLWFLGRQDGEGGASSGEMIWKIGDYGHLITVHVSDDCTPIEYSFRCFPGGDVVRLGAHPNVFRFEWGLEKQLFLHKRQNVQQNLGLVQVKDEGLLAKRMDLQKKLFGGRLGLSDLDRQTLAVVPTAFTFHSLEQHERIFRVRHPEKTICCESCPPLVWSKGRNHIVEITSTGEKAR